VREGIEDCRILAALRDRLKAPSLDVDTRDRIRHLIHVELPNVIDPSVREAAVGLKGYVTDVSSNDETFAPFRHELMACVAAICGKGK
jgi:hypothetical protein